MCVSTLPLCQIFHHCISVFPPVSVFPALRQYVCQDVYYRVSISTTVCLYFHNSASMCACHSVSALVPLCQYFHNCVSVFPPVSVFPARCECFQHCQCQYCVGMSMQWCIQSVYYVMQCSKVPFTHTHTHTHTQARGVQGLCMRTASWRTLQQGTGTGAHRSSQQPRRAVAHHRRSHTPPRRQSGTGRNSYTTSCRPPTGPRLHHIPPHCGLAWLVWACFVGW